MKKIILLFTCLAVSFFVTGQIVSEDNLKDFGYGQKKLKKAPKKVYVKGFSVNYQVLSSSSETSASNKTKGQMTVGLEGIDEQSLQEITNNGYQLLLKKLKEANIEIVDVDKAANTDMYSDWVRLSGGTPSQSQLIGYISTAPEGFDFFVKKVTKKGKGKGSFFDTTPKLSKQMGDIPVLEANINFQFVTIDGRSSYLTEHTKMKGTVNYEIPQSAIAQSSQGIFGSKIETNPTSIRIVWKGGAAGAGALSIIQLQPKKGIDVPGVVEEKKFKDYVKPGYNYNVSSSIFTYRNELNVTHVVKVESEVYKRKTQQALNEYITVLADSFISNLNK